MYIIKEYQKDRFVGSYFIDNFIEASKKAINLHETDSDEDCWLKLCLLEYDEAGVLKEIIIWDDRSKEIGCWN